MDVFIVSLVLKSAHIVGRCDMQRGALRKVTVETKMHGQVSLLSFMNIRYSVFT